MARRPRISPDTGKSPFELEIFPEEIAAIPPRTLEKVRLAILELEIEEGNKDIDKLGGKQITIRKVRDRALCDQRACSALLKLYKAGRMPPAGIPWGRDGVPVGRIDAGSVAELAGMVERATTDEERQKIAQKLGSMLLLGQIDEETAKAVRDMLREARMGAKEHRTSGKVQDSEKLIPCTEEGANLIRLFEGIVDDQRRDYLSGLIQEAARSDEEANPHVDTTQPEGE